MLDRSAILRDAHSRARWTYIAGGPRTYRECLAAGLRMSWEAHKMQAAFRANAAQMPTNVIARVADLRLIASAQNLTSAGAAQFRALRAQADEIEMAARLSILPAPSTIHAHL